MTVYWAVTVAVPIMHTVSEAVFEHFTVFAHPLSCPTAVTEKLETVIPHIPEVIVVYVALPKTFAVNVGTGADSAVDKHRGDVYASVTEIGRLPHLAFVWTEVTFAGKGDIH